MFEHLCYWKFRLDLNLTQHICHWQASFIQPQHRINLSWLLSNKQNLPMLAGGGNYSPSFDAHVSVPPTDISPKLLLCPWLITHTSEGRKLSLQFALCKFTSLTCWMWKVYLGFRDLSVACWTFSSKESQSSPSIECIEFSAWLNAINSDSWSFIHKVRGR